MHTTKQAPLEESGQEMRLVMRNMDKAQKAIKNQSPDAYTLGYRVNREHVGQTSNLWEKGPETSFALVPSKAAEPAKKSSRLWYRPRVAAGFESEARGRPTTPFEDECRKYNLTKSDANACLTRLAIRHLDMLRSAFLGGQTIKQTHTRLAKTDTPGAVDHDTGVITHGARDIALMPLLYDADIMWGYYAKQEHIAFMHRPTKQWEFSKTILSFVEGYMNTDDAKNREVIYYHSMVLAPGSTYKARPGHSFDEKCDWIGVPSLGDPYLKDLKHPVAGRFLRDVDIETAAAVYSDPQYRAHMTDCLRVLQYVCDEEKVKDWPWYSKSVSSNRADNVIPVSHPWKKIRTSQGYVYRQHTTILVNLQAMEKIPAHGVGMEGVATYLNAQINITTTAVCPTHTNAWYVGNFGSKYRDLRFSHQLLNQSVTVKLGYGADEPFDPKLAHVAFRMCTANLGHMKNRADDGSPIKGLDLQPQEYDANGKPKLRFGIPPTKGDQMEDKDEVRESGTTHRWALNGFNVNDVGCVVHAIGKGMGTTLLLKRNGQSFFVNGGTSKSKATAGHMHFNLAQYAIRTLGKATSDSAFFHMVARPNMMPTAYIQSASIIDGSMKKLNSVTVAQGAVITEAEATALRNKLRISAKITDEEYDKLDAYDDRLRLSEAIAPPKYAPISDAEAKILEAKEEHGTLTWEEDDKLVAYYAHTNAKHEALGGTFKNYKRSYTAVDLSAYNGRKAELEALISVMNSVGRNVVEPKKGSTDPLASLISPSSDFREGCGTCVLGLPFAPVGVNYIEESPFVSCSTALAKNVMSDSSRISVWQPDSLDYIVPSLHNKSTGVSGMMSGFRRLNASSPAFTPMTAISGVHDIDMRELVGLSRIPSAYD